MTSSFYIGLMSGTSLDGVDAVLANITYKEATVLAHMHHTFPAQLRQRLEQLCAPGKNEIYELGIAETELTHCYTAITQALLAKAKLAPNDIRAIGCHGQTLRHHPELGFSLQANNPGALAAQTGIDVVSDFRRGDIALGGQGAPLVPQFHLFQFAEEGKTKAVLNLGGIANISLLNSNQLILGFDTGPANTLLDAWCRHHTGRNYDANGSWAATGKLIPTLLQRLLADPYFAKPTPKSTGREHFNLSWLTPFLQGDEAPEDVQFTLTQLTAISVAKAIVPHAPQELIVCGGGAYNTFLMEQLALAIKPTPIRKSEDYGLPVDQVEATAFAWLAWANLNKVAGNAPQATGAEKGLVLGGLYHH